MRRAVFLLVVAAALAAAPPASAGTTVKKPGLLFVERALGGELVRTGPDRYRLDLRVAGSDVATFTDRPSRSAGAESTAAFVARWAGRGFAADPPNAALVINGARKNADVAMLTLSKTSLRRGTLSFAATPLRTSRAGALEPLRTRAATVRPGRFGPASLFVDDGSTTIYQSVQLAVSGAQPGQRIAVQLTPSGGADVAFSTGPPFQTLGGLEIESQSGSLPLSQLSVGARQATFQTVSSGGGGALSFVVSLYLAAEANVSTFALRSASDPGVQVTAQIGNALPQAVGATDTLFAWSPI